MGEMRNAQLPAVSQTAFDLFRLSKSKSAVDLCPNTIRAYFKMGLPSYRMGKAVFISRTQLQAFILTTQNQNQ
jgi:hypothetical protein